jgi:hypothetical protein
VPCALPAMLASEIIMYAAGMIRLAPSVDLGPAATIREGLTRFSPGTPSRSQSQPA